jgi:hypothetical protein
MIMMTGVHARKGRLGPHLLCNLGGLGQGKDIALSSALFTPPLASG